ncbi:MAG TPA: hypothetical protein DCQ70_03490, partial [Halieaceae bacterium]|nr:hypothetical protein [Halieaceae bacterium]
SEVRNPARRSEVIGHIKLADAATIESALALAHAGFPQWSALPVNERAQCLQRLADALETHRDELIALCCKEAGKTLR